MGAEENLKIKKVKGVPQYTAVFCSCVHSGAPGDGDPGERRGHCWLPCQSSTAHGASGTCVRMERSGWDRNALGMEARGQSHSGSG